MWHLVRTYATLTTQSESNDPRCIVGLDIFFWWKDYLSLSILHILFNSVSMWKFLPLKSAACITNYQCNIRQHFKWMHFFTVSIDWNSIYCLLFFYHPLFLKDLLHAFLDRKDTWSSPDSKSSGHCMCVCVWLGSRYSKGPCFPVLMHFEN
jgi:hypothetical protein